MRWIVFGVATIVASVPFVVGALTVDEIRAQIESLIAQIDQLQRQLGAPPDPTYVPPDTSPYGGYGPPISNPGSSPASFDCPYISRSLKRGSTGDDVARLQQFLAFDPSLYPEAIISGYYGGLTEAAIRRFQCKNKIVCDGMPEATGYGVTGPRTAALLALQCSNRGGGAQSQASGFLRVTPISGAAPLPVAVEVTVNTAKSCSASSYELDFGDSALRIPINVPANACNELRQTFNHTYVSGGGYVILLRSGTHQITASVNVSGGSTQSGDTFAASPTTGVTPLTVTFTGMLNSASVCNAGPYGINFGDGQSATINISGCTPNTYTVSHVYSSAGVYAAKLNRAGADIGSAAIVAGQGGGGGGGGGGESGGYFAVSPGVGGDVFTVEAEFELESSCARYDLDWGDGSSRSAQSQGSCSASGATKRVTHTYNDSGTYTLTLKRGTNLTAEDTVGVSIVY